MRLAIAGFMHESNTFHPQPTDRKAFEAQSLLFGPAIVEEWQSAHHEMGGFLAAAQEEGFEAVPLVMAWATPSGPVEDSVLDEMTNTILEGVRRTQPDGLLLGLHGAMVARSYPDADGEVLTRLRAALGPTFPLVTTFDLHGNLSERAIQSVTAAVAYRTNPHLDQRECGRRAARLLVRSVRGEIRPVTALAKPPLMINIMVQDTSLDPLKSFMDATRVLEQHPGILAACLLPGFAYSDVPQLGPSVVVVADGDRALAQREADRLGQALWDARAQLTRSLPDAATAVQEALHSPKTPVLLIDTGDNVGGGSAADGTVLLAEMIRQKATDGIVCLFAPDEVAICRQAGIGAEVTLTVGGKVDRLHGDPVPVTGRVRVLHDGTYVETQPRHGGKRINHMGLSAVVEIEGRNQLLLTTLRHPPFSLGQLTCVGLDPARARMIVVKAAIAYKAAYLPIAEKVIEVDTPGLTAVNPRHFQYKHCRHPLYPLDP